MKKTKVLHVTTHLNSGGITTYIHSLAKYMNQNSHEISVLSSGGGTARQFEAAGIKTFELSYRTKSELNPAIYFEISRFIELAKKERIDLIHAHTRVAQVMSWWAAKATGIPFLSTCHGFYKNRFGRRLLPAWGAHTIAVSGAVEDYLLRQFHLSTDRVTTILNGVDIQDLEMRLKQQNVSEILCEWKLHSAVPIIGIIARLIPEKGHEYLVRALAELRTQYSDIKLVVVGEGPFEKFLKGLIRQLGLERAVVFTGNLEDVTKALSVIDIFVMPVIWRESFGFSIIEAMALSKPVVVTDAWALSSSIQHRVNGFLIKPHSISAIAKTVAELIENEELRRWVGSNARTTAVHEFSIDRMADRVKNLYSRILERSQK